MSWRGLWQCWWIQEFAASACGPESGICPWGASLVWGCAGQPGQKPQSLYKDWQTFILLSPQAHPPAVSLPYRMSCPVWPGGRLKINFLIKCNCTPLAVAAPRG